LTIDPMKVFTVTLLLSSLVTQATAAPKLHKAAMAASPPPSDTKAPPQRIYRFSLHVHKRADITSEEFSEHWRSKHGPLVTDWLRRYGILKYAQYHTPPSLLPESIAKWPDLAFVDHEPQYDGVVEITVRDIADFYRSQQDPFYINVVAVDEARFAERDTSKWTIGWEEVVFDDVREIS
jgi:hypothetical protein